MGTASLRRVLEQWASSLEGFVPPAASSEGAISSAEVRLGVSLPRSYRDFLLLHNGWHAPNESVGELTPVEQIRLLSDEQTASVAMLMSPRAALSENVLRSWLQTHQGKLVQIAAYVDGYLLLDTSTPTAPGECQTCFVAPWIPGTRRYRSFAAFMRQQWQTYQGAHPVLGSPKAARKLNLRKPPDIESIIRDPEQFISELLRLDYFRYTTDAARDRILNEFRQRAKESRNQQAPLREVAPDMPLMDPETKRCIWLDQDAAIHGRGSYYLGILRQLLANVGTELPVPREELSEASYAVAFDAIRHTFFKMRHGKPALLGGDVASNEWRYYADQTAILANKYLRSIESEHRICTLQQMHGGLDPHFGLAFVCLTDELSYLFCWSEVDNECQPLRPDVWR